MNEDSQFMKWIAIMFIGLTFALGVGQALQTWGDNRDNVACYNALAAGAEVTCEQP